MYHTDQNFLKRTVRNKKEEKSTTGIVKEISPKEFMHRGKGASTAGEKSTPAGNQEPERKTRLQQLREKVSMPEIRKEKKNLQSG